LNGLPICGAVLISPNAALTAAHCTTKPGSYSVRAGSSHLNQGGQIAFVKEAVVHPGYNTFNQDYDLTILKLSTPLSLSAKVKPIRLPRHGEPLPTRYGLISGWGGLSEIFPFTTSELRGVLVPVVPQSQCRSAYQFMTRITSRMFCAGYPRGGKDSCQGDSGGPFVAKKHPVWYSFLGHGLRRSWFSRSLYERVSPSGIYKGQFWCLRVVTKLNHIFK
ncbi:hypothetical protein NQ317_015647, partial [Molorchus minor]